MFDQIERVAPSSLEDIAAGPELAAALADVDVDGLAASDRIDVLVAHRRLVAHYDANAYADMVAVEDHFLTAGDSERDAFDGAAAEIRVALHLTRRAADAETGFASMLWRRLPRVAMALLRGDICPRRARVLAHDTVHLPELTARAVVRSLLDQAGDLTTGQLRARVRRACIAADPNQAQQRLETTVERRRVVSYLTESGTGNLSILDGSPEQVAAASRLINHLALQLKNRGDERPMDQLRADVALDLQQGGGSDGLRRAPQGGVLISTDLPTLAGLEDRPGELAGFGPIVADLARQVVAQQHDVPWEYVVTDPATGDIVASGTTQQRPTTSQARFVRARDPVCAFPGCRMPAVDSDIDHQDEWARTGLTDTAKLAACCRHDHGIRHNHGWTYRRFPDGRIEWTTRLGRAYTTPRDPP